MALKALPVSLSSLVVLISTSIPLAGAADTVDDSRCNCYISNNSDLTYYSNHKFYDFRSLSEYAGIPGLLQNPYEASTAGNTSDYFKSETWNSFWETQAWNSSDSKGATTNAATAPHGAAAHVPVSGRDRDQVGRPPVLVDAHARPHGRGARRLYGHVHVPGGQRSAGSRLGGAHEILARPSAVHEPAGDRRRRPAHLQCDAAGHPAGRGHVG